MSRVRRRNPDDQGRPQGRVAGGREEDRGFHQQEV